jgi:low temperature requirement protein LtrA
VDVLSLVLGGLFLAGGIRSLAVWVRHPLDSPSYADQALFAAMVTGRVGLWLAMSGLFVMTALIEEFETYRWYVAVPIGFAALQLLATVQLGRRSG